MAISNDFKTLQSTDRVFIHHTLTGYRVIIFPILFGQRTLLRLLLGQTGIGMKPVHSLLAGIGQDFNIRMQMQFRFFK